MSSRRSPLPDTTFGRALGSIALLAALLGLLARPADAEIVVYVSDTGEYQGIWQLSKTSSQPIKIWIQKGTGDDIYGYEVAVGLLGFGCFVGDFLEGDGDVVYHPTDPFSCQTTKTLRASLVVNPALATPLQIGTLTVDADAEGPTDVRLLSGNIVAADLALENIPGRMIARTVPEPAEILLLAGGIAGLAGLNRLRRGSTSAG